jgi:Tfp pilus assembly protein FimT
MKRLLISLAVVAVLIGVIAAPVMADQEQSVGASVSVNEVVSITLSDAGTSGINFGNLSQGDTDQGDVDQSEGTPAIGVVVESETSVNVDIGIKATGADTEVDWKYTKTFTETPTVEIPDTYGAVYSNQGDGTYAFYHWITIPGTTLAGTYNATIYYKAVKTGTSF